MGILVSVILPVYNGEKYICDAVQSVFAQSCKDWELIIVDDCSTDKTLCICSKLKKISNVVVLRSEWHLGVSGARNIGLKAACGKYIVFLDADDTLTENSLEMRVARMEEHNLAMGVFNCSIIVDGKQPQKTNLSGLGRFDAISFWRRVVLCQAGNNLGFDGVWDKIFRNDIIQDKEIRFREKLQMYEDSIFSLEYIAACGGWIEVADINVVNYYKRSDNADSLTAQFWRGRFRQMHDAIKGYFLLMYEQLDRGGIFNSDVQDGFYHGYINKIIGALYACGKEWGDCGREEIASLFEDKFVKEGIETYKCKSQGEDPVIIEILKEKNVDRLTAYLIKRAGCKCH